MVRANLCNERPHGWAGRSGGYRGPFPKFSSARHCLTQKREAAKLKMTSYAFFAAAREIREVLKFAAASRLKVAANADYLIISGKKPWWSL